MIDDVLVRPQVVLVLVLISFVPLVTASVGPTPDGARLLWALQQAVLEVIEGAYAGNVFGVEAAKLVTPHNIMASCARSIQTGWRAGRPWPFEYSAAK
jgi:hypothetical protein